MEQRAHRWQGWAIVGALVLFCLCAGMFLAYRYVIWPIPASWVALHSPGTLPQIRALIRLQQTGPDYVHYQIYIDEGRERFAQAAHDRSSEVQHLLIECLRSDDNDLRFEALNLVGWISERVELQPALCDEIVRGTGDVDDDFKYAAFGLIKVMPGDRSAPILEGMLSSPDEQLRVIAITSLAKPGSRMVTKYLLPMLQAQEPGARAFALDLLLITGDPEAIPAIRGLSQDVDGRVAGKANEFLRLHGQQP